MVVNGRPPPYGTLPLYLKALARTKPWKPTEPRSASPTNSYSEILPTASPPHRLARGSCASRFPELSGLIHGPGVQTRLEEVHRWQADATYACGAASGGS